MSITVTHYISDTVVVRQDEQEAPLCWRPWRDHVSCRARRINLPLQ